MKHQQFRIWLFLTVVAVVFAAAVTASFPAWWAPEVPVLKDRFDQIGLGMTEEEVGLVMRLAPGDHVSFVPATTYAMWDPRRPSFT
jgi:hypothetical protein